MPWPYWLGALSVSACCAELAYYASSGLDRYSQFTVGSIVWRNASKVQDYLLLSGLVAGFALTWATLLLLERRVEHRLGQDGVRNVRALVAYAAIPSLVWVTGLFLGSDSSRWLLRLSAGGVGVAVCFTLVATWANSAGARAAIGQRAAGIGLLITGMCALSPLIATLAINRLSAVMSHSLLWTGEPASLWLIAGGALTGFSIGLWCLMDDRRDSSRLAMALVASQCLLPWGFLLAIPTPWISGTTVTFGVPTGRILGVTLALIAFGYLDLGRRARRLLRSSSRASDSAVDEFRSLSPIAIIGALFFIKAFPVNLAVLDADDYHFGELLTPWWSVVSAKAVPFWDHVPARGLVNYASGLASALLFDGTATGVVAATPFLSALTLLGGVVSLGSLVGLLPAAGAFLLMPVWGSVSQIDVVNSAFLAALCVGYREMRPVSWLLLWAGAALLAFLWAPAQGSALILATAPLALWQLWRAWQADRNELLRQAALFLVAAAVLFTLTPLGRMTIGAVRYGAENASVGAAAHAVEWAAGAGAVTPLNLWLFEGVRTSWIVVGLAAVAALIAGWTGGRQGRRKDVWLVALPVALLALIFIYRAAGRIDPGSVSRLGFASIWMTSLLLPIVLHAAWGPERWPAILALSTLGAGLLAPALAPVSLRAVATRALEAVRPPSDAQRASLAAFRNIGWGALPSENETRLTTLRQVLDILLDEDETYLDLTNRNAHYFYLGRRLPIEAGALYNLPSDSQQLRAVQALKAKPVPVVLASADSMLFDGGPQSYRAYAIYRYLIWRYVPVKIGALTFLIAPERLARLEERTDVRLEANDPAMLLDEVFRLAVVHALPRAWGESWSQLALQAERIMTLPTAEGVTGVDVEAIDSGRYKVAGPSPSLLWHLPHGLDGRNAGLFTFEFACANGGPMVVLELAWAVAGQQPDPETSVTLQSGARLVVPLDAAPRWLRARDIDTIRLRLPQPATCATFTVTNLEFWQRKIARATDPY